MKRKVYLEGELAQKYGRVLELDVDSFQDAFKLLDVNFPGFRKYLVDCHEAGVGFILDIGTKNIEKEEDLIYPVGEGDMVITPVPAGSKSGMGKILAAIAIVAVIYFTGGFGAGGWLTAGFQAGATAGATMLSVAGMTALSMSLSLAMQGIMQLMAPDPATDSRAPQAYLFNGSEQNIIEGDPVPLLYGELRVPGRPISIGVINNVNTYNPLLNMGALGSAGNSNSSRTGYISSEGNIYVHSE